MEDHYEFLNVLNRPLQCPSLLGKSNVGSMRIPIFEVVIHKQSLSHFNTIEYITKHMSAPETPKMKVEIQLRVAP